MRNLVILLLISTLSFNFSCKPAESLTPEEAAAQLAELETIIKDKSFRVNVNTVYPFNTAATINAINTIMVPRTGNNANRIDVTGDGHFVELHGSNHTKGDLPFFGEQRFSGNHYNNIDRSIFFDGAPEKYSIKKHDKKTAWEIKYSISDTNEDIEVYDIQLLVFPNRNVEINITSTLKTSIRFTGTLKQIEPSVVQSRP
ncbi:DUF4251 domain-containing protein [Winogradskyella tangerina]|uniref:DUF4251 domain-containing protein n=1 Tax=Winogradskyella tangerina TaxID=2023240 RepID=UPI0013005B17|nr:DUF4251 domain-containing protein [Winogradskyella tangerina]